MHLCKRKKSFINIPRLIYVWSYKHRFLADLEFWREGYSVGGSETWHYFHANCGKIQYVSEPLHRYTNIRKAEIFYSEIST